MVIKVQGEQPFQILSTSFSIGPSTSGYDLYFSADGVNYTQLFTVGANVNRQVTQVAAGSYYKLVGNTGNVVVNWYGNCVVDSGGGGGQYVLPVASQSTLGGVKIGSGITIDSGGTISVEGGGEEWTWYSVEDYNELSKPEKGALYDEIKALVESGETKIGFYSYTEDTDGYDNPILNYERYVFSHYQDVQIYFQGVFAYRNIEDDEDENGYFVSKCLRLDRGQNLIWYNYDSIEGGSGESNYVIVDDLDNTPELEEGKMAFVREHVKNEYEGVKIYVDDPENFPKNADNILEGYLARVHWGDWDESTEGPEDKVAFTIYQSGTEFYWDWNNDGNLNDRSAERDDDNYSIKYRTFRGNATKGTQAYFEFYPIDETSYGDYIIKYSDYVTGETIVYEEKEPGARYTYRIVGDEEAWVKQQDSHYLYIGDADNPEATEDDRIAFYNAVMANIGDNWYMDITRDGQTDRYYFEHVMDRKPVFCYDAGGGLRRGYALNADGTIEYYHEDRPDIPSQAFVQIDSAGTMSTENLNTIAGEQMYRVWLRYNSTSSLNPDLTDSSYAPLKYVYRQYEDINDEVKLVYYIGAEIMIGGTLYKGTWHFIEWEWGDQPFAADTWTAV